MLTSLLAFAALPLVHQGTWTRSLLAAGFLVWMLVDGLDPH